MQRHAKYADWLQVMQRSVIIITQTVRAVAELIINQSGDVEVVSVVLLTGIRFINSASGS